MKGVLYKSILFGSLLSAVVTGDVKQRIFSDEGDKGADGEEIADVLEAHGFSYDGEDENETYDQNEHRQLNDNFEDNNEINGKNYDDTKIFLHINQADNNNVFRNTKGDDIDEDYDYIDEIKVDGLTGIQNYLNKIRFKKQYVDTNKAANNEEKEVDEYFYDYNDLIDYNGIPKKKRDGNEIEDYHINIKKDSHRRQSYKYTKKDRNINILPHKKVTVRQKNDGDKQSRTLSPTVNSTSNYFHCSTECETSELIFYGTNGWTFPVQDVNLTLSYPLSQEFSEPTQFWITGFRVVVYIDGSRTKGCISGGGLLQDHIALTFVSNEISSLVYRFWLFGTSKSAVDDGEMNRKTFECN